MLELHGNIHLYSTQPNEKLNDFSTQYYHRNTSKKNNNKEYLLQLVQKRNITNTHVALSIPEFEQMAYLGVT